MKCRGCGEDTNECFVPGVGHMHYKCEAERLGELLGEERAEVKRLQKLQDRLGLEFPDQLYVGVFGMGVRRHETLLKAMARWYEEFDNAMVHEALSQKENEIEQLRAVVGELPKCWQLGEDGKLVQDVPVVPGMTLFVVHEDEVHQVASYWTYSEGSFGAEVKVVLPEYPEPVLIGGGWEAKDCYSTREAAEAAKGKP